MCRSRSRTVIGRAGATRRRALRTEDDDFPELRDESGNRIVEIEAALLVQHHHRHRGDRPGHRVDAKQRTRRHRRSRRDLLNPHGFQVADVPASRYAPPRRLRSAVRRRIGLAVRSPREDARATGRRPRGSTRVGCCAAIDTARAAANNPPRTTHLTRLLQSGFEGIGGALILRPSRAAFLARQEFDVVFPVARDLAPGR